MCIAAMRCNCLIGQCELSLPRASLLSSQCQPMQRAHTHISTTATCGLSLDRCPRMLNNGPCVCVHSTRGVETNPNVSACLATWQISVIAFCARALCSFDPHLAASHSHHACISSIVLSTPPSREFPSLAAAARRPLRRHLPRRCMRPPSCINHTDRLPPARPSHHSSCIPSPSSPHSPFPSPPFVTSAPCALLSCLACLASEWPRAVCPRFCRAPFRLSRLFRTRSPSLYFLSRCLRFCSSCTMPRSPRFLPLCGIPFCWSFSSRFSPSRCSSFCFPFTHFSSTTTLFIFSLPRFFFSPLSISIVPSIYLFPVSLHPLLLFLSSPCYFSLFCPRPLPSTHCPSPPGSCMSPSPSPF